MLRLKAFLFYCLVATVTVIVSLLLSDQRGIIMALSLFLPYAVDEEWAISLYEATIRHVRGAES